MIGAVDIGGTKIAAGIVDDSGKVLSKLESPTDAPGGYANGLARMIDMLCRTARVAGVEISGIGIGSTGVVYPGSGAFGDVDLLPGWQGHNPVQDLAREFQVTVALENDADASALGEAGWGAGKLKSRLIYVTVGTGIGGGIILDGQLYRGADMAHPEISHHVIDPSGPDCSCGYRGCWESLATGPAMAAWFNANAAGDRRYPKNLSAAEICEAAKLGEQLAAQAVEREAYYLGLGVANLINLFVPDVIVLGGSVMKSAALFLDGIRKVISQGCRFVPYEKTELALASLGEDANLIGAARVWHHRFSQGVRRPS
ncbi:MAG: ROK family protein [Candidatus Acidiferrum sp.]